MPPKTDPKEIQIDPKSSSDVVKNEKNEMIDFVDPSLAKSLLLAADGGQDGASMTPGSDF